ncbi:MAG: hypothetical protein EOO06_21585 [Chitinophagaceae bacterium]|nr:MAG: hypothetical protein EOO06_21585 [Chitinophagaceae bacterium]
MQWVRGAAKPDIIAVDVLPKLDKIYVPLDTAEKNRILASYRFIEAHGKLFILSDKRFNTKVEDAVAILRRYDLLVEYDPKTTDPRYSADETLKEATYYFCRHNLPKYKKRRTSMATGFYDPPNVKCIANK